MPLLVFQNGYPFFEFQITGARFLQHEAGFFFPASDFGLGQAWWDQAYALASQDLAKALNWQIHALP